MQIKDLNEATNTRNKTICVDVQPAYSSSYNSYYENKVCEFLANQKAPILMLVNADRDGLTDDTLDSIHAYWYEIFERCGYDYEVDGLPKMEFYDKGYGYLRGAMDQGVEDSVIIKVIREMYAQNANDSRMLFGGDYNDLLEFLDGNEHAADILMTDAIIVEWIPISKLREYNRAYNIGGGRAECLREVELLMNAFNIKYKEINDLIY